MPMLCCHLLFDMKIHVSACLHKCVPISESSSQKETTYLSYDHYDQNYLLESFMSLRKQKSLFSAVTGINRGDAYLACFV